MWVGFVVASRPYSERFSPLLKIKHVQIQILKQNLSVTGLSVVTDY